MADNEKTLFDNYANNYHETLNQTLSVSGENTDFFAIERLKWLKYKLSKHNFNYNFNKVLDYGCGTGDTIPLINRVFKPKHLVGIDLSYKNIEVANINRRLENCSFYTVECTPIRLKFDLAYCNGVFHHIPIKERNEAVKKVYNLLNKNGVFALWENNPWNPGTNYIMKKCPFDADAITLSYNESKKLLQMNGFEIINVSFCFIFPKALKFLRFIEKNLSTLPIGAQYLVLAKKIS